MYEATDQKFATAYYHWFFLIQPNPARTPYWGECRIYLRSKLGHWGKNPDAHTSEAVAEYLRCFCNPDTIHSTCEDYRAAASIDLLHDREDKEDKLTIPLLALWGEQGFVGNAFDVLNIWRQYAHDVSGHPVSGGHFLAEEAPKKPRQRFYLSYANTIKTNAIIRKTFLPYGKVLRHNVFSKNKS